MIVHTLISYFLLDSSTFDLYCRVDWSHITFAFPNAFVLLQIVSYLVTPETDTEVVIQHYMHKRSRHYGSEDEGPWWSSGTTPVHKSPPSSPKGATLTFKRFLGFESN